ncbi:MULTISPECIES: hypothetical protein [unclassified Bradyrhizobium]|uniref:hypothetical protein n=1 Tax=unclassified Bradyrhizobium TaxID=2631580 RepID=UPI00247914E1|nr:MULTISPECIES: hypothetical protein [unclassified Bradyrhizobium]WGR74314.1 hypothetical protein MTX24_16450 [Bradyrhizobium sp. ISRA426]WGR79149.1 hypothetical protein MTX21_01565 [Bradyrhizobium sp. ISRA430]WGR90637.1 hypothetical protein MTX25_39710 [Bradyrhizobium sp. ISRA432]
MSYFDRRYSAETHDHRRDLRKHDSLPHRLDRRISTAIDIALLCRCMDNIEDAAALIDQYADSRASEARLDAVRAGAGA